MERDRTVHAADYLVYSDHKIAYQRYRSSEMSEVCNNDDEYLF